MRELHISIVYHPDKERLPWLAMRTAVHRSQRLRLDNCIICRVDETVSDDDAIEKVRKYFHEERGLQAHQFDLRIGHNEFHDHREGEPELVVGGVTFKPSVAA